jgi:hypothetical protein
VSVPRLAAIEHPFGQIVGRPGDREGQLAVLAAILDAVEEMTEPGSIIHLPFEWTGPEKEVMPPEPPPIVGYLKWHPWELPRLFSRDIPQGGKQE